jgi:hypothetical protein
MIEGATIVLRMGQGHPVDKTQNAQEFAPQSGSALLAATNPPGWRPAALDHESCDPILIQAPADPISSKDATFPGTTAEAVDSAEKIRMQRTSTDPLSLPNRNVAGKQSACEAINVPKTSAGNQNSTRVPTVSKPPDLAQKPSRNTLTSVSSAYKALDTVRYGDITPGADHRDADGDQRHHVTGISNANATHTTYEGDEEDQNQEEGKGTGEKEGEERDRVYEMRYTMRLSDRWCSLARWPQDVDSESIPLPMKWRAPNEQPNWPRSVW